MEKNKELTPMQEFIEWLTDATILDNQDKDKCVKKATELIPKEKQVIRGIFIDGKVDEMRNENTSSEDYYNNKFKND